MDINKILGAIGSRRFGWRRSAVFGASLPAAAFTYAQGGEDMALYKRLKNRVPDDSMGFYIDIGCGDPHQLSNTFLFYCFGWRGICIDANSDHASAWAKQRPGDVFISAAIGERDGTTTLFRSEETNWGMTRIGSPPRGRHSAGVEIPMRRLDGILSEHAVDKAISFMTIDVEGSERGVLASNDWTRWRPLAILIETDDFSFERPADSFVYRFLKDQGYVLSDKIGENLLFERDA